MFCQPALPLARLTVSPTTREAYALSQPRWRPQSIADRAYSGQSSRAWLNFVQTVTGVAFRIGRDAFCIDLGRRPRRSGTSFSTFRPATLPSATRGFGSQPQAVKRAAPPGIQLAGPPHYGGDTVRAGLQQLDVVRLLSEWNPGGAGLSRGRALCTRMI